MHDILAELNAKGVSAKTITEVKRLIEVEASRKAKARAATRRWRDITKARDITVISPAQKPNEINEAVISPAPLSLKGEKGAKNGNGIPQVFDLEKDLYLRGKQVLGDKAGGQITKLVKAYGGSFELARAALERAATKGVPLQYIAGLLKQLGQQPHEGKDAWLNHVQL